MSVVTLVPADFSAWNVTDQAKLAELITDALAQAAVVAPCITEDTFQYAEAARATLRESVLRRLDAGTGALVTRSEGTGPFQRSETIDNRLRRTVLQPSDIADLQRLCALHNGTSPRGGSIDLDPGDELDPFDIRNRPDLWFQINVPWYP